MKPAKPARKNTLLTRALVVCGMLVGLVALYGIAVHFLSLEALVEHETTLRTMLKDYPIRAFCIATAAYTLISFVPGTTGKSLAVAWLFGFWPALVMVNVALTVAAIGSLFMGRYLLQAMIAQRWQGFVVSTNEALRRDGGFYVLLLRLLHAPYTIVNYSLGATSIKTRTFWWATQIGLLPGNIIFVYAGTQLPSIRSLAEQGIWSLHNPRLIVAFVLLTVAPLLIRWLATRLWPTVEHDVELGEQQL